MSIVATKFGLRMRQEREIAGLSQEELANSLNLSRISVANYEGGKQCPNLETAIAISQHLKFSLDELARSVAEGNLSNSINQVGDLNIRDGLMEAFSKARKGED